MQFNVMPRMETDFTVIHSAVTLNEVFLLFQATGPLTLSPVQVTISQVSFIMWFRFWSCF